MTSPTGATIGAAHTLAGICYHKTNETLTCAAYLQPIWVVLGLAPAVMFVTGALMWWNRVWRRRAVD